MFSSVRIRLPGRCPCPRLTRAQKKPFTAVTVNIENLTSGSFAEDDLSGIPDLVEVIKLQASGPAEAARAIRKKLKYGNVHRQVRALVILDGLIQNAGPSFQRGFADEPLLERLRVCGNSSLSDPVVKKKCTELFREWSQYATTPGLERIARLYKARRPMPAGTWTGLLTPCPGTAQAQGRGDAGALQGGAGDGQPL